MGRTRFERGTISLETDVYDAKPLSNVLSGQIKDRYLHIEEDDICIINNKEVREGEDPIITQGARIKFIAKEEAKKLLTLTEGR